ERSSLIAHTHVRDRDVLYGYDNSGEREHGTQPISRSLKSRRGRIIAAIGMLLAGRITARPEGPHMISWITRRFWPRLYGAANKWQEDDGLTWAASLAYYGAFSFFPLVLVLIAGAGVVLSFSPSAQFQQQQLIHIISDQVSPKLAEEVDKVMSGVKSSAGISGPV